MRLYSAVCLPFNPASRSFFIQSKHNPWKLALHFITADRTKKTKSILHCPQDLSGLRENRLSMIMMSLIESFPDAASKDGQSSISCSFCMKSPKVTSEQLHVLSRSGSGMAKIMRCKLFRRRLSAKANCSVN